MIDNTINLTTSYGVGRRMTFLELINEYCIVIPVIQRDYAQGRLTEKITELRNNFVKDLIAFIHDPEKRSHDLDAIYGSVQHGQFIPLDGQQRLTTLFLLHLYITGMKGDKSFSKKIAGRFSYKTRHSSTMFCEELIERDVFSKYLISHNSVHKKNATAEKNSNKTDYPTLSNVIKNQGWYFNVWCQDPTIAGMLVMLDCINQEFIKNDNSIDTILIDKTYNRLFDETRTPPITFLMLPLIGYTRTDDLYIKMNARGVHLTDYENFKAKFEDLVSKAVPENDYVTLKKKIDKVWAESLWEYCQSTKQLDIIMERIIRYIIGCSYRSELGEAEMKEIMEYLLEQNKKTMRFTFSRYSELGVFHKRGEDIMENEIDIIHNINNFFDVLCDTRYTPLKESTYSKGLHSPIFSHFIEGESINYSHRLLLYAYLIYIQKHSSFIDNEDLSQWMRLIHNLDAATRINSAYDFNKACQSIDDLDNQISDIEVLAWLKEHKNYDIKWFRKYQFQEECIKARLILCDNDDNFSMRKLIYECENHSYMEGQIGFLLHISGLWTNQQIDIESLSADDYKNYTNKLGNYSKKAISIFDSFNKENDGNNSISRDCLLERALLAKGWYLKHASSDRLNFCNDPYHRDYSWKAMLIYNPEETVETLKNDRSIDIFRQLLDDLNMEDLENSLTKIITDAIDDGTYISIFRKNPSLIKYCSQGFINVNNETSIRLLSQSKLSHYHSELWTRNLYELLKDTYTSLRYRAVRKSDDDCAIYFEFKDNNLPYLFNLYHWEGEWSYDITHEDPLDTNPIPTSLESSLSTLKQHETDGKKILLEALKIFTQ